MGGLQSLSSAEYEVYNYTYWILDFHGNKYSEKKYITTVIVTHFMLWKSQKAEDVFMEESKIIHWITNIVYLLPIIHHSWCMYITKTKQLTGSALLFWDYFETHYYFELKCMQMAQTLEAYSNYSTGSRPKEWARRNIYISQKNRIIHLKNINLSDKKSMHDFLPQKHVAHLEAKLTYKPASPATK